MQHESWDRNEPGRNDATVVFVTGMSNGYHTPVLVEKVIEYLVTTPEGVYVDATIGGGGHAEYILQQLSAQGKLIGFDRDSDAIAYAEKRLRQFAAQVVLIQENFVHMRNILNERGIIPPDLPRVTGRVEVSSRQRRDGQSGIDGVLLDLGISSFQIDQPGKGFSFQRDEPLDMRMDKRQEVNAATLLRVVDGAELARILREYSEERFAKKIARAIVRERNSQPIETTKALASIVQKTVGGKFVKKSLARVFQALRIAVNDELNNLRVVLKDIVELLNIGGRVVVISYHSLEDRIVKEFFKAEAAEIVSGSAMVPEVKRVPRLRILTKKPIVPTEIEVASNNRARSAKLRAAERM